MDDFREDYAVIDVDYFKGQILVIDQNNEKFTYLLQPLHSDS